MPPELRLGLMDLAWGSLLVLALLFGGLQLWWLASLLQRRALARPLNEREFRRALERIWARGD